MSTMVKTKKGHHNMRCYCRGCDLLGDCTPLVTSYENLLGKLKLMPKERFTKPNINKDITLESHYGEKLCLWIISLVRKEWVKVENITGDLSLGFIVYDINSNLFRKSLTWLGVGAYFFLEGEDPNKQDLLAPVLLPPEYLEQFGIIQDDLTKRSAIEAFMASRDLTGNNHNERAAKRLEDTKAALKAASQSPLDKAISELSQDWQLLSNYPKTLLAVLKVKKIKIESKLDYPLDDPTSDPVEYIKIVTS